MITLVLIGLLGGLITGVSPCILPMLPIIFFAGAGGGTAPAGQAVRTKGARRLVGGRPVKIISGVIVSFTVFTLTGSLILSALGLPQTFLRWAGVTVLLLVGVGMLFPQFEQQLQRPFNRLPKVQGNLHGTPFLFGLGLGTLYVPCAGPVLAAITVAGATGNVGAPTVTLTVAFAVGAAVPLLFFAAAGDRIRDRLAGYRRRAKTFRLAGGVSLVVLALALGLGATDVLQRAVPDYTKSLQTGVTDNRAARGALSGLTNAANSELSKCTPGATVLQSCGTAPPIKGGTRWLNTPGGGPVSLSSLRGKVTLIDFWAYSCINCQRSLPHVVAWNKTYAADGLQVIGIHSPEFAFEKSTRNVQQAIRKEGIPYPVAQDNDLATWTNYRNRYWPAEYLIDSSGTVRNIKFGEGDYAATETMVRQLLTQADPSVKLPGATKVTAPVAGVGVTPETYFAYSRSANYQGDLPLALNRTQDFTLAQPQRLNTYTLGGNWNVGTQYVTGNPRARLKLSYTARNVYMVLGGTGRLTVNSPGRDPATVQVTSAPRLYPILTNPSQQSGQITITTSGGVHFYTATFG